MKVFHISDSHLTHSQYGHEWRSEVVFEGLRSAILEAVRVGADIIVHSGDLLDSSRPTAKVIQQVMEIDALLKGHAMEMLTVTGNHDLSSPTWLGALFPWSEDLVLPASLPSGITCLDWHFAKRGIGEDIVSFFGIPGESADNVRAGISAYHGEKPTYLVVHATLAADQAEVMNGPRTLRDEDLFPLGAECWLMGDLHEHKSRSTGPDGTTLVLYPGSTSVQSVSEDDTKYGWLIHRGKAESIQTFEENVFTITLGSTEDNWQLARWIGDRKAASSDGAVEPTILRLRYTPGKADLASVYSAVAGIPRLVVLEKPETVKLPAQIPLQTQENATPQVEAVPEFEHPILSSDYQLPDFPAIVARHRTGAPELDSVLDAAAARNESTPELASTAANKYLHEN
jgi:predicted phosphodiesterase